MDAGHVAAVLIVVALVVYAVAKVVNGNRKERTAPVKSDDDDGRGHK